MKKLMIAAAIVCAAAFAQAASVAWNSGSSKLVDSTGTVLEAVPAGSIVLVVLADQTGWADGTWSAAKDSLKEVQTGAISGGKAKGKVSMEYKFDYGSTQAFGENSILAAVFKDVDGSYSQLTYQADGSAVTETLKISGLDSDLYSGNLEFATKGNFMAQSVPEPTSAMLLLLGVAGLALKRRRA